MVFKLLLLSTICISATGSEPTRRRKNKLFNDPKLKVDVLITSFQVGSLGLNLHLACHNMIVLSLLAK